MNCEQCQSQILDYLYELLDTEQRQVFDAHLQSCPACQAAMQREQAFQSLLARAALNDPVTIRFQPPVETPNPTSNSNSPTATPTEPAVTSERLSEPSRKVQKTLLSRTLIGGMILAASLLIAPLLFQLTSSLLALQQYQHHARAVAQAETERTRLSIRVQQEQQSELQAFRNDQDERREQLVQEWLNASKEEAERMAKLPHKVELFGPQSIQPGAPNSYRLRVQSQAGQPSSPPLQAALLDSDGKTIFRKEIRPEPVDGTAELELPSDVWAKVGNRDTVRLEVSTVTGNDKTLKLVENLELNRPVYSTFLATDKPLYRPGEVVFFRALTLDRNSLLPPDSDRVLSFELKDPSGKVVPNGKLEGIDLLKFKLDPQEPDSDENTQTVRGIGAGTFQLPTDAVGGEYTLTVNELSQSGDATTLASRKLLVNQYTPDQLRKTLEFDGKSYGPGDVVQAKLTVKSQSEPLANARLSATILVDGDSIQAEIAPNTTDEQGAAQFRWQMPERPAGRDLQEASFSVTIDTNGVVETIVRPVPLASRFLNVQFFPEGGDLIAGVPNRVYVQITDRFGKAADAQGVITDGLKVVADWATLTDPDNPGANRGMAKLTFTPESGKRYFARLSRPINALPPWVSQPNLELGSLVGGVATAQRGYTLPEAKDDGVALQVLSEVAEPGEAIRVRLGNVGKDRQVLLGAYTRGQVVAHLQAELSADQVSNFELPVQDDGRGGVTRLTVFELPDEDLPGRQTLKPVAERLIYRKPAQNLNIEVNATHSNGNHETPNGDVTFTPRDMVNLSVRTTNEDGEAVPAVLWAAVVNQNVITQADDKTERLMPTHFYLCCEVRGPDQLEQADFLLTDHPLAQQSLDLLLGTQGWRRFAEQAPEQFRQMVAVDDAERLLASLGIQGPIATPIVDSNKTFQEYWPKFVKLQKALAAEAPPDGKSAPSSKELLEAQSRLASSSIQLAVMTDRFDSLRAEYGIVRIIGIVGLLIFIPVSIWALVSAYFYADNEMRRVTSFIAWLSVATAALIGLLLIINSLIDGYLGQELGFVDYTMSLVGSLLIHPITILAILFGLSYLSISLIRNQMIRKDSQRIRLIVKVVIVITVFTLIILSQLTTSLSTDTVQSSAGIDERAMLFGEPKSESFTGPVDRLARPSRGMDRGIPIPTADDRDMGMAIDPAVQNRMNVESKLFQAATPPPMAIAPKSYITPTIPDSVTPAIQDFAPVSVRSALQNGLDFRAVQAALDQVKSRLDESDRRPFDQLILDVARQRFRNQEPFYIREYAHTPRSHSSSGGIRTDFTETLLWVPVAVTNKVGHKSFNFGLSDSIAPYRILVSGHTLDGRIGAVTQEIEVRKPLSVDIKLPPEISSNDRPESTMIFNNDTGAETHVEYQTILEGLNSPDHPSGNLSIAPRNQRRMTLPIKPASVRGQAGVRIDLRSQASGVNDSIIRQLEIVPDGYPYAYNRADMLEGEFIADFRIPKGIMPGTLDVWLEMQPNRLAELQSGLEGMLREPHGCFEQTSSTNYPNILISRYLRQYELADVALSQRCLNLLDRGYKRLSGFESVNPRTGEAGGFEWFGAYPPQQVLTAYGLMQFTDMDEIFPVDPALLKRTRTYLLSRRDGKGSFLPEERAQRFGGRHQEIIDAYICWAISEANKFSDDAITLDVELARLNRLATDKVWSQDPYFLALVGNSLINDGQMTAAERIFDKLAVLQAANGSIPGAQGSITNSAAMSLLVETTSLAILGWLKLRPNPKWRLPATKGVNWLAQVRTPYGTYGSTQATILALKANLAFSEANRRPSESGELVVRIDDKVVARKRFSSDDRGAIRIPLNEKLFTPGKDSRIVVTTDAKEAYQFSANWAYRAIVPDSSESCPIRLNTSLSRTELTEGDVTQLKVRVANEADQPQGMVTAIVGIPAGVKLPEDAKQLKLLTAMPEDGSEPKVAYWETRGRELILYWRGMEARQVVEFSLDLIAEYPGLYRGPASQAYLYYVPEYKQWAEPTEVRITPKGR